MLEFNVGKIIALPLGLAHCPFDARFVLPVKWVIKLYFSHITD